MHRTTPPNGTPPPSNGTPMRIKLIGGDPGLGYMLRQKLFWKDSMQNRHGEYSHALQWLAIAQRFNTRAADLYRRLGEYATADTKGDSVYLWQWLADCFPDDMPKYANVLKKGTLVSQSYRSPQVITDYLVRGMGGPIAGDFLSGYLCMRYMRRKWLSMRKTDKEGSPLKLRILEGDAKGHAVQRGREGEWANSTQKGKTGESRWIRQSTFDDSKLRKRWQTEEEVEFHGVAGTLYFWND